MVDIIGKTPEEQALEHMRGKAMMQGFIQHACFDFEVKGRVLGYKPERLETSLWMMPAELQAYLKIEPGQARRLNITTDNDMKFAIIITADPDERAPCWTWKGGEVKHPDPIEPPARLIS